MKYIQIKCNTKGEVNIDDDAKANGLSIALVDEKNVIIARYELSGGKLSHLTKLMYVTNNAQIHFCDNIMPTMTFEITSPNMN